MKQKLIAVALFLPLTTLAFCRKRIYQSGSVIEGYAGSILRGKHRC